MKNWFDVDKDGLAKILERRGKHFAIAELISNAWDQNVTEVDVYLQALEGTRDAELIVIDDDPNGFSDLTHSFTMFAESEKKDKADKRGRFNLGEKLVLALCKRATIQSTTGGVRFDENGRHSTRLKLPAGSEFRGVMKMTKQEIEDCTNFVLTLIPPFNVRTNFNGFEIEPRIPVATFTMPLETHLADDEGNLRKTVRQTTVNVYEPLEDEIPSLYEMGIPVVETNDKWHIDIGQKVPLSLERDNVPPAYLRKVRAEVINHMFAQVKGDDASAPWVKAATDAPEAKPEAVNHVLTEIYGDKRVVYDPSDKEANRLAADQGYTIIHPRSLSAGQWQHVRDNKLALPAGQVTPSPKAIVDGIAAAGSSKFISRAVWTEGMELIADYADRVAEKLGISPLTVEMLNDSTASFAASCNGKHLTFNVGRLGYSWFEKGITLGVDQLLLRELALELYPLGQDSAVALLGAKLKQLAIKQPEFFKQFERVKA